NSRDCIELQRRRKLKHVKNKPPRKNERLSSLSNSFYTVLFVLMLVFLFNANTTLELSFLNLASVPSSNT
ncbi:hypothetical protein, partial [Bacillus mobilis]|uniref:hypothetical protein n=1 Tax=Bacillus mobilis TaxID=2026190 RepID=UPI00366E25AB